MSSIDPYPSNSSAYTVFIAAGLFKSAIPLEMMRASFEVIDKERAALLENGPWTARTASLERYATVDTYA